MRRASRNGRSISSTTSPRTSSHDPGDPDPRCARAQRQHDRRGARLELVHQPHPRPAAVGRRGRRAVRSPERDRRPAPGRSSGPKQAGFAPGFTMRDAKGETLVRLVRREGISRSGDRRDSRRQQDLLGARLLAGRELPGLGASRSARRSPIRRRCGRRPANDRPMRLSDIEDVLRRVAPQRRRQLPRRRGAGRPGPSARRLPLLRHASRRSERHRPARTPARAARAEGVRRLDEPRGHEGGQHARRAGHGERPRHRSSLPAGRRLDVRHRRERAARLRRRLRSTCSRAVSR